jgi:hypothetical protein
MPEASPDTASCEGVRLPPLLLDELPMLTNVPVAINYFLVSSFFSGSGPVVPANTKLGRRTGAVRVV